MSLELYHYQNSVCSQKVRLVLAEKGLSFTSHHVDLMTFENLAEAYLAINPAGVVPTLVDEGRVITESSIIIEYLDDAYPDPPLKPDDAVSRAAMRSLIRLEDDTALEAVGVHTMNIFIGPMMASLSKEQLEAMRAKHPDPSRAAAHDLVATGGKLPDEILAKADRDLADTMDRLEAQLGEMAWRKADTVFLVGDCYSLADATWVPFLRRMELLGKAELIAPERRPNVARWYAAARTRPSFDEAITRWEQSANG